MWEVLDNNKNHGKDSDFCIRKSVYLFLNRKEGCGICLSGGAVVIVVEINLTQMRYNSYNNHELDRKMNAKLIGLMELLEEKGTELREPYSAPLEDGIFELRCKLGSNITRALYFFYVGKRIVVTNGFVKKTQKTPPGEIKIAKDRRKDWIERQERENKNAGKNGRR